MNKEKQVEWLAFFMQTKSVLQCCAIMLTRNNKMKIIIFGGTGSIGRKVVESLNKDNYEIIVVSRNSKKTNGIFNGKVGVMEWDYKNEDTFREVFTGNYAILNLAGENIGAGIWTKKQKDKILNSRVSITSKISEIVNKNETKPTVFIQASATGYYGASMDDEYDESSPKGVGFLAEVCARWENALKLVNNKSMRIIFLRTGVVLDKNDGLIAKMKTAFKLFVGGHFGNGKQWMSWIHIQDEVNAIKYLLENQQAEGIYNLTSPKPERMRKFCKIFGAIQYRLSWFHIPAFILKLLPGNMGEELLLSSQKVKPVRLLEAGFDFKFINLEDALRDILIDK